MDPLLTRPSRCLVTPSVPGAVGRHHHCVTIRYLYVNQTVTYTQLLVAARKADCEVSNGKLGTMTIKVKLLQQMMN